jgi:hypothetical protein
LALPVPPLPLRPGARYRFLLMVDGTSNPDWELAFGVAPMQLPQAG